MPKRGFINKSGTGRVVGRAKIARPKIRNIRINRVVNAVKGIKNKIT